MRELSKEEFIKLRNEGKIDKLKAMKALSADIKTKKAEKAEKPKVDIKEKKIVLDTKGVEDLVRTTVETSNKLIEKIDEIIEVERRGPLNTKWKLTVQRDNRDLIDTIDVVTV